RRSPCVRRVMPPESSTDPSSFRYVVVSLLQLQSGSGTAVVRPRGSPPRKRRPAGFDVGASRRQRLGAIGPPADAPGHRYATAPRFVESDRSVMGRSEFPDIDGLAEGKSRSNAF